MRYAVTDGYPEPAVNNPDKRGSRFGNDDNRIARFLCFGIPADDFGESGTIGHRVGNFDNGAHGGSFMQRQHGPVRQVEVIYPNADPLLIHLPKPVPVCGYRYSLCFPGRTGVNQVIYCYRRWWWRRGLPALRNNEYLSFFYVVRRKTVFFPD